MTDCNSATKVTPLALVVDRPEPNVDASVQAMMGSPTGRICICNGKASRPDNNTNLVSMGVRMACRRPTDPVPTNEELFSTTSPVFPSSLAPYTWTNNNQVDAYVEENPTANNNVLYVRSSWINMTMPGTPIVESQAVPFRGKRVQVCPSVAPAQAHAPAAAAPKVSDLLPGSKEVEPWDNVGGAIEYRHLAVDQIYGGNRLLRHGVPLKARRIAISACDVSWQYGIDPPNLISRSVGEIASAPVGWLFMGLPQASIVIWQGDSTRRRTIISECRDKPDVLALDPQKSIYVQVNFAWASIALRAGSFGLHVRVID